MRQTNHRDSVLSIEICSAVSRTPFGPVFRIPHSQFPIPHSPFPIPHSEFGIAQPSGRATCGPIPKRGMHPAPVSSEADRCFIPERVAAETIRRETQTQAAGRHGNKWFDTHAPRAGRPGGLEIPLRPTAPDVRSQQKPAADQHSRRSRDPRFKTGTVTTRLRSRFAAAFPTP